MKIFFTAMLSFLLLMTTAQAAKVDAYRDILSSGRFTLKYTIIEPPVHVTDREATLKDEGFFGYFKLMDKNTFLGFNNYYSVIVHDGENRYYEKISPFQYNWIMHILKKNGEIFRFYSYGHSKTYYSFNQDNKISANLEEEMGLMNSLDVLYEDYSYGILTTALLPIVSPDKIIATPYTPEYKFVDSGTLDNRLYYEDFFGSKNGFNCAIRYYFSGDTLAKIAVFDYVMKDSHVQSYEKYLIKINEFSSTPDQKYLTLPAELKDKTKRNKGAKK